MILFACARCGTKQQVADDLGGKKVACAKCGQRLRVPEPVEMHTLAAVPIQKGGPAAPPAGKDWYYHQGGKPCGPITWPELKRLAADGDLSDEDPVWRDGMAEWKAAKTLPNLFPHSNKAPKPGARAGGGGHWLKGKKGVYLCGGLVGAALLIVIGYFVFRPGKPPARDLEPDEIFKQCSPSVARVRNKSGTGSGFIARPGIVVTNHHVVDGDLAENIEVTFPSAPDGNKPLRGVLLYEDRKRDLAILRVDTALPPLPLAEQEVPRGKRVVVIGSPAGFPGRVVENSVTAGTMSAPRTQMEDSQLWDQIDVAVNPGNSGGPVFDSRGRVIGVVTRTLRNKQAMNYAVPIADVVKALDRTLARGAGEHEEAAAQHDVGIVFHKVGKLSCLYLYGMRAKSEAMKVAVAKGARPDVGLRVAANLMAKPITTGTSYFLNGAMQEALPRVVGHKAIPETTRQQMTDLVLLQKEIKDWYDNPRGTVEGYRIKTDELANKMTRAFEALRLKLGINEDPRITLEEKAALSLPDLR